MNKIFNPEDASEWLKQGKILIHPTEGVWGIGCDAFNQSAVEKVNILKQRDSSKSFILLAPSTQNALQYFHIPIPSPRVQLFRNDLIFVYIYDWNCAASYNINSNLAQETMPSNNFKNWTYVYLLLNLLLFKLVGIGSCFKNFG